MITITLDNKLFDYSLIKEPLVAVPKSFLKRFVKSNNYLSHADLIKSAKKGREDIENGNTVNAFDFVNSL